MEAYQYTTKKKVSNQNNNLISPYSTMMPKTCTWFWKHK